MAKQADSFPITSTPVDLPADERQRIEAAIQQHLDETERLVARLDASDPDPDLEDGGDDEPDAGGEPSLGWTGETNQVRALKACRDGGEDMEDEHDGREPCCEDEGAQCEDEGACETAGAAL